MSYHVDKILLTLKNNTAIASASSRNRQLSIVSH